MKTSTLERTAAVDLTDSELLAALEDRFAERRVVDAEITRLAAQVGDRSCVTLGREGLATRLGENSRPGRGWTHLAERSAAVLPRR